MIDGMHANAAADITELLDRATASPGRALLDELGRWWDERSPTLADQVAAEWLELAVAARAATGWRVVDVARALLATAPKAQGDLVERLGEGVGAWRERHGFDGPLAAAHVVGARQQVRRLGTIPFVTDADAAASDVDAALLGKVRALLAKAESTTFEAEAEALFAKAHQLMVRNAIDEAVLHGRSGGGEVGARRVFLDDPYARAKFSLLSEVSRASSCRALLSTSYGFATVFGHAGDLDAVELLYTSLLLQATGGVVSARPASGRRLASSQVAAFRRSWLLAFAQRVGERLELASAATVAEASEAHGRNVLPVLAAKDDAVEAHIREAVPHVKQMRTTASSGEGWAAGRQAGDRASLRSERDVGGGRAGMLRP
jgi:hypothetical protein